MTRYLLDVNVLLALLWPRHMSHFAAHAWFAKIGHKAWATNPLVQLGVLRLLTNPAVTQGAVGATNAVELVRAATTHPNHEFWPLNRDVPMAVGSLASVLRGHRQWTDALLLAEAKRRDAILITFDTGVSEIVGKESSSHVMVLKEPAA
jgi:toxin-antitoxin system PIN domain toxin